MRNVALLGLRWITLAAFAVWFGGFTFYSAVVIPVLHDELGGVGQGAITGEVTNTLNAIGIGAVAAGWVLVGVERSAGKGWGKWARVSLLGVTTALLIGLVALHPILDERLEAESMRNFYALHRVYLIVSTAQWVVNLALLAITLRIWDCGVERAPRSPLGFEPPNEAAGQMWTDSPSP